MRTFVRTREIEHDIGPAGRFALRVTNPDVEIIGAHGTLARVRIRHEIQARSETDADEAFARIEFDVRTDDGVLEVGEPRRGEHGLGALARLLGGDRHSIEAIDVEVPGAASVEYNGVSGDLTARGLVGPQAYRTVSGDMVIDGGGGSIRVQGVSGDVSVRADGPVALDAKTVSGDVSAFAPAFDSLRVVTVSGDAEAEGTLAPGVTHRVETVSGDFSLGAIGGITLEVRGLSTDVDISLPHRSEGSRERRRFVIADGAAQLAFSSMSGDVSLSPARRVDRPTPPTPPTAPTPPTPPTPPSPPTPPGLATEPRPADAATDELAILRALEHGEIDVEEAARRLAEAGR